ncbi:hypothetical protein [Chromobacterium violaceum]|uniref:hypothetical protein n=1 Tax=Chromobacterium violaceum TaxID=536 RepID=UPI001594DF56|nr:hypothetical protein [Chromobacterium violaceum]MBX9267246.1 hypothetical protein [Chromobacterium violaceum]MBX9348777.1 hypothetical protein [Chromobacterium vaccinii]QRO34008.1 hypothetical protein I6K04_04490 [Chromobacterium violaceum]QRQ16189.1 hypothetical protein I6K03_18240 [Chromobacterium violaceum]
MKRNEWKRAWRFVRAMWPQINQGDGWKHLTAQQHQAAQSLDQRNTTAPAHKLALPF